MKQFQLAWGSVTGRDHLRPLLWNNGQDALSVLDIIEQSGVAVAVVSDGCGSGEHSEVGSKIGARFVAHSILGYIPRYLAAVKNGADPLVFRYWEDVRQDLLAALRPVAQHMGPDFKQAVKDYFLFTLVGFVVTPHASFVFSIGDGVYSVNGKVTRIGPFDKNAPPYVGYGMIRPDDVTDVDLAQCRFQVNAAMLTSDVESLLVGTDGACDLIAAADKALPGHKAKGGGDTIVGPFSQFWEDDAYFANPQAIRRKLALANNPSIEPDWVRWQEERITRKPGLLPDDTTLAVIRRTKPPIIKE